MFEVIEVEKQKLYRLIDQQGILGKETIAQSRLIDKLILIANEGYFSSEFEKSNIKKLI